jgi:pimeloyl-ACP methyl ester carboxylesterase
MTESRATFAETEARVLTLYGAGKFDEALEVARRAATEFPDRVAFTSYWAACLEGAKGKPDAAARSLEEALDDGATWWGPELLLSEDDLAALRGRPDFEEIVGECERRAAAARAGAHVQGEIFEPAASERDGLLVALHGRTGNLADSAPHWRGAAAAGITTIVLQSSQMVGSGMHCWDDLGTAMNDVAVALRSAFSERPRDGVVLGGFSQGGGVAARIAIGGELLSYDGFISVCPSFTRDGLTPDDLRPLMPGAARARVSGWMVLGEDDERFKAAAHRVLDDMEQAGVSFSMSENVGVGHEFPPRFDVSLTWMLDMFFQRAWR